MVKMPRVLPKMLLVMVCTNYLRVHSLYPHLLTRLSPAKANRFDVVLVDTAGRMQDNEPLMRSLSKVNISKKKKRFIINYIPML